jgi:TetR/AcrR family transcriptional regulator, cholesterol catabolism regulator
MPPVRAGPREGTISGLREARKQATRRRVLDAARELFEEVGYENATIRAIARRAGVSVGSIFTSFSSKSHVLSEVMQARLGELYGDLERVIPHLRGSTADRCRSLFAVHYAFEFRRLHLFLAFVAAVFDWRADPALPAMGANPRLRGMVLGCLSEGRARGDVRSDADIELAADLLIGAYAWNYRLAALEKAESAQLTALFDRQVGLIFEGLAPG